MSQYELAGRRYNKPHETHFQHLLQSVTVTTRLRQIPLDHLLVPFSQPHKRSPRVSVCVRLLIRIYKRRPTFVCLSICMNVFRFPSMRLSDTGCLCDTRVIKYRRVISTKLPCVRSTKYKIHITSKLTNGNDKFQSVCDLETFNTCVFRVQV
jgi:hypothetical protein